MSTILPDRELKVVEVLDYLDGPTLFVAEDGNEHRYLCAFLRNTEDHTEYICSTVARGRLNSFLTGNMELREAMLGGPIQEFFLLQTTASEDTPLMATPVAIGDVAPELLPAEGYLVPIKFSDTDERTRNRALLDASLDVPESQKEHVLPAYTLAGLLLALQDFLKFCYKSKVAMIQDAEKRKSLGDPMYSTGEVYATSGGSFTVSLRSAAVSQTMGPWAYVPMEMAFDKAAQILSSSSNAQEVLEVLRSNKGHLVSSYRRLLDFLVENKGTLSVKWRKPSDEANPQRFKISLDDAVKIQAALSGESGIEDVLVSFTGTVPHANTESGTWTIVRADGEHVRGELQKDAKVTLAGVTLSTVRYTFFCKEELVLDALGKEKKKYLLYDYREAPPIEDSTPPTSLF